MSLIQQEAFLLKTFILKGFLQPVANFSTVNYQYCNTVQ